jgi:two-component system cell cycle response regulator
MRLTLRKTDVAFRHGGDEFAVILPSTDACKAGKVIQRLRTRWEQVSEVRYKSLKTPLGFSAGIAQLPGDAVTADGLLAIADITMYHAKELGKYRTEMASDSRGV